MINRSEILANIADLEGRLEQTRASRKQALVSFSLDMVEIHDQQIIELGRGIAALKEELKHVM